jgi:zinc protease
VFPGHPYEPQGVAADSDLRHLGPQDALDFFTAWYRPDRIAVIVAGDVEAGRAAAEIERLAAGLTGRSPDTGGSELPEPRRRDIRLHRPGTLHQLHLAFSVPPPGEAADPWPLLADIMAGGRGGLTDRALVDSLGLAHGCEAVYEPGVFGGLFQLQVTLSANPDFDRVREILESMLEDLSSAGPPAGAVERSVARLAAARAMSLDTHAGQAREAGWRWVRSSSRPLEAEIGPPALTGIARAIEVFGAPARRVWLTVAGEEESMLPDDSHD